MLLNALGGDFSKVKCSQCGELEFLIPVDVPFDEVFLANYHCDKCDDATLPAIEPMTEA